MIAGLAFPGRPAGGKESHRLAHDDNGQGVRIEESRGNTPGILQSYRLDQFDASLHVIYAKTIELKL